MSFGYHESSRPSLAEYAQARTSEKRFLKGEKDIAVTKDVIIGAEKALTIPVLIAPDSLPPFEEVFTNPLAAMRTSMRSRFAQLGLDADDFISTRLARLWQESAGKAFEGNIETTVQVTNWSQRPVKLSEGTSLFRFFYWNKRENHLKGEELMDAVRKHAIKIEGEYGHDWKWRYLHPESKKDAEVVGIYTRISDERLWIPPSQHLLTISDEVKEYRPILKAIHEPAPLTKKPILTFGKSPFMTLEDVEAILSRDTFIDQNGETISHPHHGWHINSLLIDGKKKNGDQPTKWPVIVEIVAPTEGEEKPQYVAFDFALAS